MKKRVLGENGKFANFKGERVLASVKPVAKKIAERKVVEKVAEKNGFDASNPAEGGLSKEDITLLESGKMNLMAVVSLANNRGIEIPDGMEDKAEIIAHMLPKKEEEVNKAPVKKKVVIEMTADDVHSIKKMSIPEMRAYAKEVGLKIPKTSATKVKMCEFILSEGTLVTSADDDL